jgi:GTP cyclohydrolase IA
MKGNKMSTVSGICENLLQHLFGSDILKDPNFMETPQRMAKMYEAMFDCQEDIDNIVSQILKKSFPSSYDGLIILPDIRTISFCPHHLLPVEYNVTIAYLPSIDNTSGMYKVIGASKPERVSCALAKRPILQEEYTTAIADAIQETIHPKGVAIIIQGFHSCMRIRGVKNPCANMITSEMTGAFLENPRTQNELFELIKLGKNNGR